MGKTPSTLRKRPWGASAAKIDAISSCSSLQLLLRSLVVAGLESLSEFAQGTGMKLQDSSATRSGGLALQSSVIGQAPPVPFTPRNIEALKSLW